MHYVCLTSVAIGLASAAPSPWGPGHNHGAPSYGPPSYGYGPPSSGAPTAKVKNGTVTGVHSSTYNQDCFLGVPFAQPPVDELRFRTPASLNSTFDGAFDATQYAPTCVGYGGDQINYPVSEDCLYLNVIRPSGYEHQSLPVGVWIHGGGLSMGGTQDRRYNLSFIVENSVKMGKPIIGVSIAYRISTWGFIASQEVMGSGNTNLGLRDQRLALHWLQENINAFGGDAKKVTIWGESAGAGSVGWHLTAYNGRDDGLFRAGIMESGNPVNYGSYQTNARYQPLYDGLVNATNCHDAIDTLDCLRHVPFDALNAVLNTTTYRSGFSPVVDGDFIQRWASIQLAEGDFVKVPVIDGTNTDEGTAFGPRGVNSDADFAALVGGNLPSNFVPEVLEVYPNTPAYWIPPVEEIGDYVYPPSSGSQYRRSAAYFGDFVMNANRRGTCQTWAANGLSAYCYRFNTIPAGLPPSVGVTHFQEVAFVFDNTDGLGYDAAHGTINPFTDKPQSYSDLAKLMSSSWASFIYDLEPNGDYSGKPAATPDWPVYSIDAPQNIVWDANVTALAFAEPDTYRAEGIQWILDHALVYHR